MKNFKFLTSWLIADACFVTLTGAFICFFNSSSFFIFNPLINPAFWADGVIPDSGSKDFMEFSYNLLGVIMMVWGILLLFILKNSFSKKEKWAWNSIFVSLMVWFPVDEFFSLYHKVYYNAIGNLFFLAIFIIPLLLIKSSFKPIMKE